MAPWRDYDAADWLGYNWSQWLSLDPSTGDLDRIPTDAGVYRVRHLDRSGLAYIGETGRSLRGRIRALARGAYADEMPYRAPHVGAPCMWAIRQESGAAFEVSFATPAAANTKPKRKSLEAGLVAAYRRAEGESPTGNFSRIIPGYRLSSYRRDADRGGPLDQDESEPHAATGIPPLDWDNYTALTDSSWMGLDWSPPKPLADVDAAIPQTDGVYRIWNPDGRVPFEYIGESANVRSRLQKHRRNRQESLEFSYAAPPQIDAKHKRLEAETDLIGAHWLATNEPPSDQH